MDELDEAAINELEAQLAAQQETIRLAREKLEERQKSEQRKLEAQLQAKLVKLNAVIETERNERLKLRTLLTQLIKGSICCAIETAEDTLD